MSEEKRGRGRIPGSKNKSMVVRTTAIREAVTVEDCQRIAKNLLDMALSDAYSPSDRIKATTLLLKYVAHSADVELLADAESNKPSPEAIAKAAMLIDSINK